MKEFDKKKLISFRLEESFIKKLNDYAKSKNMTSSDALRFLIKEVKIKKKVNNNE